MLFDLRGSGRRTTVKAVYLTLAILMGGGLVFFGIGGDVSGGLFDAFSERGGSVEDSSGRFRDRVESAQRATQAKPKDPQAWAGLARARFQYATTGDFFDQSTAQFTSQGKAQLREAARAWERHLALDPPEPDDSVANLMVQVYGPPGLNEPVKAVVAQEIITEARPKDSTFATLAVLAYQAGQIRKGDLAAKEAVARADKPDRESLKAELEAAKQQSVAAQVQDAPQSPTATPEAQGGGGKKKSKAKD